MNIQILYDCAAINDSFAVGWGFSCLIDNRILFDTGESGEALMHNFSVLKIDPTQIESIVISHEHWDHTGGMWDILRKNKGIPVFACPSFSNTFKEEIRSCNGNVIESSPYTIIANEMVSSGEMQCFYKNAPMPEQSLIIRTARGLSIVTGCSHPGIITIVEQVRSLYPDEAVHLIVGGLHLKDCTEQDIRPIVALLKEAGVTYIAPIHCTGDSARHVFREQFDEAMHDLQVGDYVTI